MPCAPAGPGSPAGPSGPCGPAGPCSPATPCGPAGPGLPGKPLGPAGPEGPAMPRDPAGPILPAGPRGPRIDTAASFLPHFPTTKRTSPDLVFTHAVQCVSACTAGTETIATPRESRKIRRRIVGAPFATFECASCCPALTFSALAYCNKHGFNTLATPITIPCVHVEERHEPTRTSRLIRTGTRRDKNGSRKNGFVRGQSERAESTEPIQSQKC